MAAKKQDKAKRRANRKAKAPRALTRHERIAKILDGFGKARRSPLTPAEREALGSIFDEQYHHLGIDWPLELTAADFEHLLRDLLVDAPIENREVYDALVDVAPAFATYFGPIAKPVWSPYQIDGVLQAIAAITSATALGLDPSGDAGDPPVLGGIAGLGDDSEFDEDYEVPDAYDLLRSAADLDREIAYLAGVTLEWFGVPPPSPEPTELELGGAPPTSDGVPLAVIFVRRLLAWVADGPDGRRATTPDGDLEQQDLPDVIAAIGDPDGFGHRSTFEFRRYQVLSILWRCVNAQGWVTSPTGTTRAVSPDAPEIVRAADVSAPSDADRRAADEVLAAVMRSAIDSVVAHRRRPLEGHTIEFRGIDLTEASSTTRAEAKVTELVAEHLARGLLQAGRMAYSLDDEEFATIQDFREDVESLVDSWQKLGVVQHVDPILMLRTDAAPAVRILLRNAQTRPEAADLATAREYLDEELATRAFDAFDIGEDDWDDEAWEDDGPIPDSAINAMVESLGGALGIPRPKYDIDAIPQDPSGMVPAADGDTHPLAFTMITRLFGWIADGPKGRRQLTPEAFIKPRDLREVMELLGQPDPEVEKATIESYPTLLVLWDYLVDSDALQWPTETSVELTEQTAQLLRSVQEGALPDGADVATAFAEVFVYEAMYQSLYPLLTPIAEAALDDPGGIDEIQAGDAEESRFLTLVLLIVGVVRDLQRALLERGVVPLRAADDPIVVPIQVVAQYVEQIAQRWERFGYVAIENGVVRLRAEAQAAMRQAFEHGPQDLPLP